MKTIEFEISYAENQEIHQNGYVEVPDDEEDMSEWFYYNSQGFEIPRVFTHHDGIGISQIGATDEQLKELDDFKGELDKYCDYVDEVIQTSEQNENKTYTKGCLIIRINDGEW